MDLKILKIIDRKIISPLFKTQEKDFHSGDGYVSGVQIASYSSHMAHFMMWNLNLLSQDAAVLNGQSE